jgi:3-deoxy-D-manno-octulosonic-acid transferase
MGEVNLLAPLIERLLREYPQYDVVLSTTTITGMAVARTKFPELLVFYWPLDFTWATRQAMRRIRPRMLVLTELEIWPNLISAARRAGASVAVINGRLSLKSFRGYRLLSRIMRPIFRKLNCVCVQTSTYAERFRLLGTRPEVLTITGSMKFDGIETSRDNPQTAYFRRVAGIAPQDVVFLAGSTQEPEEAMAVAVFQELAEEYPHLRLILVPRHPHRFEAVARLLDEAGIAWQRRSEVQYHGAQPGVRVLLVDTVGELRSWWGLAHIAFVGGSFGRRGGQNMIEPAAYGAAICFGPNTHNFQDVVEMLLAADAAKIVHNQAQLGEFVRWCLDRPAEAAAMGERARQLVLRHRGATDRTLLALRPLLRQGVRQETNRSAA